MKHMEWTKIIELEVVNKLKFLKESTTMRKISIAYVDGYAEEIEEEDLVNGTTVELLAEGMGSHCRMITFDEKIKGRIHTRIINVDNIVRINIYGE